MTLVCLKKKIIFVWGACLLMLSIVPIAHVLSKLATSKPYYGVAVARAFPGFQGLDGLGRALNDKDMLGKVNLVFFGNTRCGSICYPRVLLFKKIDDALNRQVGDVLEYNFFTIDPDFDRPEIMHAYFDSFLSNGRSVIVSDSSFFKKLKENLGLDFSYLENGQYQHVDTLFLLNKENEVVFSYSGSELDPQGIAEDLKVFL